MLNIRVRYILDCISGEMTGNKGEIDATQIRGWIQTRDIAVHGRWCLNPKATGRPNTCISD